MHRLPILLLLPLAMGGAPATEAPEVTEASQANEATETLVRSAEPAPGLCAADPDGPDYYQIELVTTKKVPGTAYVDSHADVTYAPSSPFGVSIAADGSYRYDVRVDLSEAGAPPRGGYVAWVTTSQVDEIRRLGPLGEDGRVTGPVAWNKFLVVVTLEDDPEADAERWSGPVAFRGMSRSGQMHTMAGHGPFQEENCATYGYGG